MSENQSNMRLASSLDPKLERSPARAGLGAALRRHALVAPVYLVIALLFTYPTIARLGDAIGGQQDAFENYWNLWWMRRAVLDLGQNPFEATWMHHPFGLPLYFHTFNPLNGLLSLPLQVCCGTAAAYNLLNLFAFVMAGLGMYALAWYLTGRRSAAFIAGLIYAFSPYMAFHLDVGQPTLLSTEWTPFFLLALLKGLRERLAYLPLAALLLFLIGLTEWHYLTYAVLIAGLTGLYEAVRLRRLGALPGLAGKLALVGALFALLMAPVLLPTLSELSHASYARRPLEHSVAHSADLLAFFLPSVFHPLWGEWASRIFYGQLVPDYIVGGMASLGYVALALALCGLQGARRLGRGDAGLFVLLLLVAFVLSLGPYLQVNGANSFYSDRPIPLPYLLFRQLPFMDIPRVPSRFVAVMMLALAALAGLGVAWLAERPVLPGLRERRRVALPALMALLVLFEYWPHPFRMTPVGPEQVSPFYRQLGADPSDFAILEVPYLERPSMFYQTYHQKRTVGGRISRQVVHPWWDARFFGPLLQVTAPWKEIGADDGVAAWRAALSCQNVRYVVFYKQGLDEQKQPGSLALQQVLFAGAAPAYEDATLRAYGPLNDASREPYWTPAPDEWFATDSNEVGINYRWMKGDHGALLIYPCGQREVLLRFNAYGFAQPRTLEVGLNGQPVGSFALPQETVVPIEVPLTLREGENRVELRSVEPPTSPAARGFSNDERMISVNLSNVLVVLR